MVNWTQWYNGYDEEDIEFVIEIIKFLQVKLYKCKVEETTKKKRLSIQINSIKYMYSL